MTMRSFFTLMTVALLLQGCMDKPDGKSVLCIRKGVMPLDARCGKFRYDPLKREPKLPPKPQFAAADFEL